MSLIADATFCGITNEYGIPTSKALVAGDFLYTWGFGAEVAADDPSAGMREVFEHLRGLLAEHALDFSDVIKVTRLLVNPEHFSIYNEVYREYFSEPFPVRTSFCIVNDSPILEVDLIAYKRGLSGL